MQIISIGDNLHEISNPVFLKNQKKKKKKKKKKINMLSAENFTQSPMGKKVSRCQAEWLVLPTLDHKVLVSYLTEFCL